MCEIVLYPSQPLSCKASENNPWNNYATVNQYLRMDSLDSSGRIRNNDYINESPNMQWWNESAGVISHYDNESQNGNSNNSDNDIMMDDYTSFENPRIAILEGVMYSNNSECTADNFNGDDHHERKSLNSRRLFSPPPVSHSSSEEDSDDTWIDDIEDTSINTKVVHKESDSAPGISSSNGYGVSNIEGFLVSETNKSVGKNQTFSRYSSNKQILKHRRSPIRKQQNQQLRQQQITAYNNRELKEDRMKRYYSRQVKRAKTSAGGVYQSNGCWNRSGKMASSRVSSSVTNGNYLSLAGKRNSLGSSDESSLSCKSKKVQFACN
ncbi:hypothetical protein NADFUDRAFT_82277 [Nadsonia fulvescens var. elongata DSM 6958]|uniref:Uncharacterized protein n=1 Tax=Nadsonia fulvescens var. elongata DSM 6958 TaxID=857566 RepID=A0A1E3PLZ5_9ASCO|nr:hypothetical protein NADFUDRAFT_82277 [Nadsonia fulvescens var. elongata DSM 6958]